MYRIVTENKNLEAVKRTLLSWGLDYTMYHTVGCWHGTEEDSLVIEIEGASKWIVKSAAREIKEYNQQEAVLLQEIPVISEFI
jgi:hypothetical protein